MSESKIQTKIIQRLKKLGFFTTKIIVCSRPGFPDVLAIRKGKTIYIEVKNTGKRASPKQKRVHEMMRHFGATVFVCDNIEEFDNKIESWIENRIRTGRRGKENYQTDRKNGHDYVQRKGNNFVIYVANLSPDKKNQLSELINRFMSDRKVSLRQLKSKRRSLLLEILKRNKSFV